MDSIIEEGTYLKYARICIEIDVYVVLTWLNRENLIINAEYSWNPLKCNGCMCFSHRTFDCALAFGKENVNSTLKRNDDDA